MAEHGKPPVLIVEDDGEMREFIGEILADRGYPAATAANGEEALARLGAERFPIVVSDLKMPVMGGVALLDALNDLEATKPFVILITAFGDIDEAVTLIGRGAYDYLIKPFKVEQLLIAVDKAAREWAMRRRIAELEEITRSQRQDYGLIGKSQAMLRMLHFIDRIADSHATVLVEGETGTGKELVARAIHRASSRRQQPFVAVNCAAIPEQLLESELFGHVKGAFTDAHQDKTGLFVEAAGGTLLLDEIGEMGPAVQAKILRALQERRIRPVGANRPVEVRARIIAATNKNLKEEVEAGRFREDLYYRLNVFRIEVPPLRQRREDIPLLVQAFLRQREGGEGIEVPAEVMRLFLDYPWPGNVRELENVIERCAVLAEGGRIALRDLPPEMLEADGRPAPFACGPVRPLAEVEREYIAQVVERCGGNKQKAAALLGIDRKTIRRKLQAGG